LKASVYIDGYNLHHAINDTKDNFLKWYCPIRLSKEMVEKGGFELNSVTFCTAHPDHKTDGTKSRYTTYRTVLRARGVRFVEGHYQRQGVGEDWAEKQSDINVALHCLFDGLNNEYDVAYLISGDSDQVATAKRFKTALPKKKLIPVAPPGKHLTERMKEACGNKGFSITTGDIERCVMAGFEQGAKGLIRRPNEYAPIAGWIHPDRRP
jgi:hypothetical protein